MLSHSTTASYLQPFQTVGGTAYPERQETETQLIDARKYSTISQNIMKSRAHDGDMNNVSSSETVGQSKRSRNRNKKDPTGRLVNSNRDKQQTDITTTEAEESRLILEVDVKKKAEEDMAAAEAKRIADTQRQKEARHEARLQAKRHLEAQISAVCQRLDSNFIQVANEHQNMRRRLAADKLASTRAAFQLNKKNLKSDLKKCTAFCKKIKSTTSWDAPGVLQSMIGDVETLNLSRYIEEIVSAFLECKMKVSDISALVHLAVNLHERYEEFRDLLLPKLMTFITNKGNTSNDDVKQKRIFLRFLTDLLLSGFIQDPKPIIRIVSDACGAPSSSADKDKKTDGGAYQVTDAHLVISFAKAAGHEIFGVIPSSIRADMDFLKSETAKFDEVTNNNDNRSVQEMAPDADAAEKIGSIVVESAKIEDEIREDLTQYLVCRSYIDLAKETLERVTMVSSESAVSDGVSSLFRSHASGAFKTLCVSYINTHKKLVKLEKRCEEDRLLSGSLTEQREKGLMDAQKLMETLQKSVETLADVLNESMPALVVEMEENETMNANESSGVELYKKEDDRDVNLGPFDDDETKAFYCDIPDFLSTIPPALLGYTVDEVEKLRAANILRFKTVDFSADIDDSSNSNPDTDSFSQSGEGLDEVIADGSTLTHSENDPDSKDDANQENPHYKLLALVEQDLPDCNRRDKIDELAERFCVNHGTSKYARKRIQKALVQVKRLDLLPFFSRLSAIFDRVYPEIAQQVVTEIEQQFHGLARWKKQLNIEHRMRNARYLGELTKFRVAPPIVALRCMKRCLLDFSGYNIDVVCCLLESCGRYLHRTKHTNAKIVEILDNIRRLRKVKFLDERCNALIDSALFMVVPPTVIQKEKKILDPMEAYLLDLIVVRLVPDDRKIVAAKKQITRLPWSDPRKNCGRLVTKYILKACRKGRYNSVRALAGLLLSLKRDKPEIYIRVLDTLYEEVQFALEVPNPRDHQRILSYARLLGEMCSRGLVGLPAIITQLYNIVNYGHDIPSALREACNRLEPATDESLSLRTISSKLLKGPSGVNQTIMEDEEFEEGSLNGERVVVEQVNNKPVAISPFSQFDPRVPSSIDPPSAVFRIKLVCTLLDSCVSTIGNHNKAMLNQFLASFQRYIFTKSSVPADIEFSVLDTFDLIDSKLRAINMDLNSRKIPEGYGIVRYKSWVDAHNATISYEEKDAIAESISESTALNSSGIQKAASAGEEILMNEDVACSSESDDEEDDNDYQDSIHDQSTDDNDVDVFDEDLNDDASRSTGIIEQQSNDEKDEAEGSDYDVNSVTDEDEIDEEIQQKERAQKLEEEMFEQELRRITLEAIEKGKVAARTGFGGKVSDAMPSASQYIRKKGSDLSGDTEDNFMKTLSGGTGVQFNFLKKGHKGRVEARSLIVPSDSNIAKVASKQDDKTIREKNILKARVLQYEVENSELFPPLPLNYGPRTKDRHRPLSMEDINQNFGSSKE